LFSIILLIVFYYWLITATYLTTASGLVILVPNIGIYQPKAPHMLKISPDLTVPCSLTTDLIPPPLVPIASLPKT